MTARHPHYYEPCPHHPGYAPTQPPDPASGCQWCWKIYRVASRGITRRGQRAVDLHYWDGWIDRMIDRKPRDD